MKNQPFDDDDVLIITIPDEEDTAIRSMSEITQAVSGNVHYVDFTVQKNCPARFSLGQYSFWVYLARVTLLRWKQRLVRIKRFLSAML